MNEKVLTVFLAVIAFGLMCLVPGSAPAALEILALKTTYIVLLLLVFFLLMFFLRGTKWNAWDEIVDQRNTGFAIVVAAILLAISNVIGK
jgi:Domain of Unknown Function (DUF350)